MDILQFENQYLRLPSAIDEIHDDLFEKKNVRIFIKRDDLIHPIISGNKWRKLKEYIQLAQLNDIEHLISFGGAYSNHLYALAFVAKVFGLRATAIVRGNELNETSNVFLTQMKTWGMHLNFISRAQYQKKEIPENISTKKSLIIEEGGFGKLGILGIKTIINELEKQEYNYIICPIGTGTTYLGLCKTNISAKIHGILTLNNLDEIRQNASKFKIDTQFMHEHYIFGKYAKQPLELTQFCEEFTKKHQIKIEPIYTGKMFYGLYDLILKDSFKPGSKIVALHTGGVKY